MLTTAQTEEPPQTRHDAASAAPLLTLHRNESFPRHYLAIEGQRLYPFTIEAKPLFDRYAAAVGIPLSDYTFANNIIWLSQKSGFYQIIEDCFCLFSLNGQSLTMLLPPLGEASRQRAALETCFAIMDGYNPSPYLSQIEFVYRDFVDGMETRGAVQGSTDCAFADWMEARGAVQGSTDCAFAGLAESDERYLVERSLPDYIYKTEDLINLQGNAYKTKRSEINQFRRAHPNHRMEELGPQHWDGIRELINTWLRNRLQYLTGEAIADFFYTVEQERLAIERAIEHYDTLGLHGLCLIIDGKLEGFTFGDRITPEVGNVLVEKTNFAIPGSAQYLFREFAKTFADCTYINVGDDLGLENLRRVKMSYRPALFGEKVTLKRGLAGA